MEDKNEVSLIMEDVSIGSFDDFEELLDMPVVSNDESYDWDLNATEKNDDDKSFNSYDIVEKFLNQPVVAIAERFGGHLNFAEEGAAKDLFFEMTCTCAKAYAQIDATTLCFNRNWFNHVFKRGSHLPFSLTYSVCQPLLTKYSDLFVKMMNALCMKVIEIDNLTMLHISFEPMENFFVWLKDE